MKAFSLLSKFIVITILVVMRVAGLKEVLGKNSQVPRMMHPDFGRFGCGCLKRLTKVTLNMTYKMATK